MSRISRLAPLTGVVFAVLALTAFLSASGAPATDASPQAVRAFFVANGVEQQLSDSLWGLSFAFLLLFGGALQASWRPASPSLAALALASCAVLVVGACAYFGFDYVLATDAKNLSPDAAQALNAPALFFLLPASAGGLAFGLSAALASWRSPSLPKWPSLLVLLAGLALSTGFGFFPGVALLAIWSILLAVLLLRRPVSL